MKIDIDSFEWGNEKKIHNYEMTSFEWRARSFYAIEIIEFPSQGDDFYGDCDDDDDWRLD
jgi:hypothetical protein